MARRINSTNPFNRNGRSEGCGNNNSGRGGRNGHGNGRGRGCNNNSPNRTSPRTSGYYPATEGNNFSVEERDKIRKERDKRVQPGGTKRNIGDLFIVVSSITFPIVF
jgi:hypothetical protein